MYHIITLTRYLTVIDLLQESSGDCPLTLQQTARRATVFLEALRPPDGRIPLLNDAVFCEALQLDTCLAYARALGFNTPSTTPSALTESGYFWLDAGDDRLLVDGGPFGPPHLPSHSHNDLFSILLWIDGNRLLTDTGTYSYAPTPRRQYARSVEGHNTVQIGSTEPVPIGGQYLAGKRLDPRIRYVQAEDVSMFDGKYERHNFSDRIYTHRRRIFAAEEWWLIQDHVTQDDEKPIRGRLHLHPQVAIGTHPTESAGFALQIDDEPLLYGLSPDSRVTETTTPYFPEFGIERERRAIVTETTSADETMNLLLSKRPYTYAEYQRAVSSLADVDHPDIGNPQSENQLM